MTERTVAVKVKGDLSDYNRAVLSGVATTKAFVKELDGSSDRMANLVQTSLALGPALVPVGAAAVPVIAGMSNQLAIAGAAAGVAALAFSGVGDALKATNDFAVEPTAANLEKMRQSLSELGPAGAEFVAFLQEIRPQLQGLQDAAQAGLFPGAESGIDSMLARLPQVERIVGSVADGIGTLIAEAGSNLADSRWNDFFNFIETEARTTLVDFGRSVGNLGEGFANLWMAFDPLTDDFSAGFLQMSRDFAAWTDGLTQTQGFQEFVAYIQTNGPRAWETLGAIGNALLQIVEAAAPVGAAALPVIEALADAIATVADTDLAPVAIGIISITSALSRLKALGIAANASSLGGLFGKTALGGGVSNIKAATAATVELGAAQAALGNNPGMQSLAVRKGNLEAVATSEKKLADATRARNRQFIAGGAAATGMGLMLTGLDQKMGLTNTTTLALAGSLIGPWGAALGAGIGLAKDLGGSTDDLGDSLASLDQQFATGALSLDQQKSALDQMRTAMEGLAAVPGFDNDEDRAALADLEQQYAENVRAAQDLKFQQAGLGDSLDDATDATRRQTEALIDNAQAQNDAATAALAARDAQRGYEEAIDGAAAAVKENGKNIDDSTAAGRENLAALDGIADTWNKMDGASREAKGGLEAAREEFTKAAVAAGYGADEARQMAVDLLSIKAPAPIEFVVAGADGAIGVAVEVAQNLNLVPDEVRSRLRALNYTEAQIAEVLRRLQAVNDKKTEAKIRAKDMAKSIIDSIQRARDRLSDKSITITTYRRELVQRGSLSDRGNEARGAATGGYILGPGTTTSDSIPAWLSNKEYVVKAASVEKYGVDMMHDINAGRFADGGLVGASRLPATFAARATSAMPTEFVARLMDSRVSVDGNGLTRLIDDRVLVGVGGSNRASSAQGRRRGN